jgi:hypothetical protein
MHMMILSVVQYIVGHVKTYHKVRTHSTEQPEVGKQEYIHIYAAYLFCRHAHHRGCQSFE